MGEGFYFPNLPYNRFSTFASQKDSLRLSDTSSVQWRCQTKTFNTTISPCEGFSTFASQKPVPPSLIASPSPIGRRRGGGPSVDGGRVGTVRYFFGAMEMSDEV